MMVFFGPFFPQAQIYTFEGYLKVSSTIPRTLR